MNRLEELLVILQEECAEVSQVASKCIRFGLDNHHPDYATSNKLRLEEELGDLFAIVKLIDELSPINMDYVEACANAKLLKVEKYINNPK